MKLLIDKDAMHEVRQNILKIASHPNYHYLQLNSIA